MRHRSPVKSKHVAGRERLLPGAQMESQFGIIGQTVLGELDDGGIGLCRTIENGVDYAPPPLHRIWKPRTHSRQEFEFPLPADDAIYAQQHPDALVTLAQLCRRLEVSAAAQLPKGRNGSKYAARPKEALQFDLAVDALMATVESLHTADNKCGIGLTTPEGVLFVLRDGSPQPLEAFFIDAGFHWTSGPSRPLWLKEDSPYNPLWPNHSPAEQQRAGICQLDDNHGFDPQPDLQVLGRVLASTLLGRCVHYVPSDLKSPPTCWKVLAGAIHGQYSSASELRGALAENPLSGHFLQRRLGLAGRKPTLLATAGILVLCGGLIASYPLLPDPVRCQLNWWSNCGGTPPPPPPPSTCKVFLESWKPKFSEVYDHSQDLTQAYHVAVRLKTLYQELKQQLDATHANSSCVQELKQWQLACRELFDQIHIYAPGVRLE